MLKSFAKAAAVAALVVAGAVGATTATTTAASAGDLRFGVIIGDGYPAFRGGHHHHRRHWRACSPRHALHKARRMGIHRAYVSRVGRNRVVVRGHRHGHSQRAVFANTRHCPVIAYRR